jgi:CheY-like chemotaxis protein
VPVVNGLQSAIPNAWHSQIIFMETPKKIVMVADADPHVRELVGRFISEAGYTVTYATEGYEALDSVRRAPPSAIFADVLLPRLDGLALCRLLKGDSATAHVVTVVVLSVLATEEKAHKAGADAFVRKPLEKSRVLKALEIAIGKGSTAS